MIFVKNIISAPVFPPHVAPLMPRLSTRIAAPLFSFLLGRLPLAVLLTVNELDGGAVCYLVWHKYEVDCGPQYSIRNVFFLHKHWEKNFTH